MTSLSSAAHDRLRSALLYLITPAEPKAGDLDGFLARVLEGGVDAVQLREKQMEAGPLLRFAEVIRKRTDEFGALFIMNDRVDLAAASGADGVHLGQDDLSTHEARRQLGTQAFIGLSTHTSEQILSSEATEADYIGVGPVEPTPTKPGRPAVGYETVRFASTHSTRPFFAIGGIDQETLPRVIEAGATRVCVLRALTEAGDPEAVARRMKSLLEAAAR